MSKIQIFIQCFTSVTTGILAVTAVTYSLQGAAPSDLTLWQILLSAALCALATVLFFPEENAGRLRTRLGLGLHFVSLCVIMVLCGRWFGWISTHGEAALMVLYVILVYGFTVGVSYLQSKQQTDEMNRRLRKKYAETENEEK